MTEITIEDIRKWKEELSKSGVKSRGITFDLPQGHIGNGWYRIADQCLTNKAGWEQYQKTLLEVAHKL